MCHSTARRSLLSFRRLSTSFLAVVGAALASAPTHARVWLDTAPIAAEALVSAPASASQPAANGGARAAERPRRSGMVPCFGSYWPVGPVECGTADERGPRFGRGVAPDARGVGVVFSGAMGYQRAACGGGVGSPRAWRDDRVAEGTGLLNRRGG